MSVETTPQLQRRLRPHHHAAALLCAVGVISAIWWWRAAYLEEPQTLAAVPLSTAEEPLPAAEEPVERYGDKAPILDPVESVEVAKVTPPDPAAELRSQLVGTWSDEFYGKRIFHFNDDGTATMTIELDGVGKLLYGDKLSFTIEWSIKDDVLTMTMIDGEPKGSAMTVAKIFGEKSDQRIEKMTSTLMQLRSLDSQKVYTHTRVE